MRRHQARFHAAGHAQPHHRHAARAQHIGHRERREYMSAGAPRHDEHGPAAHRVPPGMRATAERELHFTS